MDKLYLLESFYKKRSIIEQTFEDWAMEEGVFFQSLCLLKKNNSFCNDNDSKIYKIYSERRELYSEIKTDIEILTSSNPLFLKGEKIEALYDKDIFRYSHDLDLIVDNFEDYKEIIFYLKARGFQEDKIWYQNNLETKVISSIFTSFNHLGRSKKEDFSIEIHLNKFPITEFTQVDLIEVNNTFSPYEALFIELIANLSIRAHGSCKLKVKDIIDLSLVCEKTVYTDRITAWIKQNYLMASVINIYSCWEEYEFIPIPDIIIRLNNEFEGSFEFNGNIYLDHAMPLLEQKSDTESRSLIELRHHLDTVISNDQYFYSDEVAIRYNNMGLPVFARIVNLNADNMCDFFTFSLIKPRLARTK